MCSVRATEGGVVARPITILRIILFSCTSNKSLRKLTTSRNTILSRWDQAFPVCCPKFDRSLGGEVVQITTLMIICQVLANRILSCLLKVWQIIYKICQHRHGNTKYHSHWIVYHVTTRIVHSYLNEVHFRDSKTSRFFEIRNLTYFVISLLCTICYYFFHLFAYCR